MPPNPLGAALGELIGGLIALPFVLLRDFFRLLAWPFRLRQRWRAVPLEIKSHIRLRTATFALVVLIGASVFRLIPYDNSIERWSALAVAGYSLLNLGAGLIGVLFAERWQLRFDPMSIWWWCCGAASCAALLVYVGIAGW
jgi:hypothetical protein